MESDREAPAAAPGPPFQETVLRLQRFWADQGCVLLPPCDFEVPYATLQPDAFFQILGPLPWRAAYQQPVRRPLDGRYGEHPYRLLKHLQLEVLLKPPPADVPALYLQSLTALGFDLSLHDVRFAEWVWQPISLGARGTGWHVLIDGFGVTRLTFLERLADRPLDPLVVEISYGLERLSMLLHAAPTAYGVGGSEDGPDHGELRRRDEAELSRYVFEVADPEILRQRFEALDLEAGRCLEAGLARPAYELAVRCLEPLDVLEARGASSARERTDRLERIRGRVAAATDLYLRKAKPAKKRPRPAGSAKGRAAKSRVSKDGVSTAAGRARKTPRPKPPGTKPAATKPPAKVRRRPPEPTAGKDGKGGA